MNTPAIGTKRPPSAKQAVAGIPTPRNTAQPNSGRPRGIVAPAEPDHVTRNRLVRHIAADPVLLGWLREHNARVLENAANALLVEHGEQAAATALRLAAAHRAGEAPDWGSGPMLPDNPPPQLAQPLSRRRADRPPCGTPAAYVAHIRHGEPTDDACRAANTAYKADHRRRHTDQQEQSA